MRWRWTWLASCLLVLGALPATAAPGAQARWTVLADFGFSQPAGPLPSDAFVGATFRRQITPRLSLEASLGPGLPVSTSARDSAGRTRTVDIGSGTHALALARVHRGLGRSERFTASLAAGPSLVHGGVYGTVALAHGEAALGMRFGRNVLLSYGFGYESALTTSRQPFAASECVVSADCPPYYRGGSGQWISRWALGFTF